MLVVVGNGGDGVYGDDGVGDGRLRWLGMVIIVVGGGSGNS